MNPALFCFKQAAGDNNESAIWLRAVRDEARYFDYFDLGRPEQYLCLDVIYCAAGLIIQILQ